MAANSPLQEIFQYHVARARIHRNKSLHIPDLELEWEFFIPSLTKHKLTITGMGTQIKSWRAELGLLEFAEESAAEKTGEESMEED